MRLCSLDSQFANFISLQPDDLPFVKGDLIEVHEEMNSDWWRGSSSKREYLYDDMLNN